MRPIEIAAATRSAARGASPLLLGVAALLALLIALAAAAIALFVTPPPAELASAPAREAPRPAARQDATATTTPTTEATGPLVLRPPPQTLAGVAEVIDTGTLRIGAATVRLRGVVGEGGEQAARMAAYLAGRAVACAADGGGRYRCRVDGWDLSEVVLFNGGGRASADAPADLRRAETQARAARRGVWSGG